MLSICVESAAERCLLGRWVASYPGSLAPVDDARCCCSARGARGSATLHAEWAVRSDASSASSAARIIWPLGEHRGCDRAVPQVALVRARARCPGTGRAHREFAPPRLRQWPVNGEALELPDGRLEIGEGTLLEPNVWLTARRARRASGSASGVFLNQGVMVAATELVEIGDHCMAANGCFITDAQPPLRRRRQAGDLAGLQVEGPDARSATTSGSARTSLSPAA